MLETAIMISSVKGSQIACTKIVEYYQTHPEVAKKHAKMTTDVLEWTSKQIAGTVLAALLGPQIDDILAGLTGGTRAGA